MLTILNNLIKLDIRLISPLKGWDWTLCRKVVESPSLEPFQVWLQPLGTWLSCGGGSAGLVVDIPSLLQPKWFYDPINSKMQ